MTERSQSLQSLLAQLSASGEVGRRAAAYVHEHGIRLAVRQQSTGARWTLGRSIQLSPRYASESTWAPYALSLVVHEVQHVRQGFLLALSVYGELEAWQEQFRFLLELLPDGSDIPGDAVSVRALLSLPLNWDRKVLANARDLMRRYAGAQYRIGMLPLYPLHRELLFRLTGRRPAATTRRPQN